MKRCDETFIIGGEMEGVCGRERGHIPRSDHALRERNSDEEEAFGPWMGVKTERQLLCAVAGCEEEARAHACPYDGGFHHHGCIHYNCEAGEADAKAAGIVFRKGNWGLICDAHYAQLTAKRK